MRYRRRAAVALGAALLVVLAGEVSAQDYPPGGAQLTVGDSNRDGKFFPGESGSASATNLTANTAYLLDFEQGSRQAIGEGRTDAAGAVSFTFTIPATGNSQPATLVARPATGSGRQASAAIRIVASGASASPPAGPSETSQGATARPADGGGLPRSGVAIAVYVALALILIALGSALVALARRRAGSPS